MERFDLREEYKNDGWLDQVAAGKTYVNPTFEQDDYGDFLTGTAPIYDSEGRYSGFVGVDFDLQYYLAQEARFRTIAIGSLVAVLLMALVIGYLVALYYSATHDRMQELYEVSIRDSLTGVLNRRGAIEAIAKSARHRSSQATMLVDIDNLKMINDLRGHATGDAVIALTAEAMRESIREGDICARFGGDEFLIYAPDCEADEAERIAKRILARLSGQSLLRLAGAKFSVSLGIAVHDGDDVDFAQMYRDADAALHQGREDGKSRIGVSSHSSTDSPVSG
jgi:diguanylate cyclase (GGDEF)-like protein